MIPIKDHRNPGRFPIINYTLIGINLAVFGLMFTMSFPELRNFIGTYAVIPSEILRGQNIGTIFTSMFLHGSILHLFGNMLFLYVFGDNVEDAFGHISYLAFYLLAGLGATLLQVAMTPMSAIPNIGASGAIAGVLGGYLLMFPKQRVDVLIPIGFILKHTTVPAYTMLIFWIGFQLLQGVGSIGMDSGGIAYFAHIGGFFMGMFLAFFFRPSHLEQEQPA